jgi:uncharacterized protein YecE (DUF72 family)
MPVFVGTSGWQYRDWKARFYPEGVPQKKWLEHYAGRFQVVESNAAFYRLPEHKTFEDWARRTPADFVMAVKASRYLTHILRLRDPAEPVGRLLDNAAGLGDKLGPILLQLPPTLKADVGALAETLEEFSGRAQVAVEFRHPSWFTDQVRELLGDKDAALCLVDRESRPVGPLWRTADWSYLRLHAGRAAPYPCYGRSALSSWADRLAEQWAPDEDVYVFFNNDTLGCAVRDASVFVARLEAAGLKPTRVPARSEVTVG